MDLIIDLGNTNKKLALFQNGKLAELHLLPDFTTKLIRDFIKRHPVIEHCILASVIDHPASFNRFLGEQFNFIELDENTPLPIKNLYRQSKTLGKDRLAAAVAGAAIFPGKNVLVINMGSCITYDFMNDCNEYLGGAISPGMQMRFQALNTFTAKLPLVTHKKTVELIGTDTENSVLSGVLNGINFEIEGTVAWYRKKYSGLKVILSGGDMIYFDKRLKISIFAVPNVVLQGLYQILAFNVKKTN
jgi:type III pantothenate kinase